MAGKKANITISEQEKNLCAHYVETNNKREAGRRAGYKGNNLNVNIYPLFKEKRIVDYIAKLKKELSENDHRILNLQQILINQSEIATAQITDFVDISEDGDISLKKLEDMPREKVKAIKKISKTNNGFIIEMVPRQDAYEKIIKMLGFYDKDNAQKAQNIVIDIVGGKRVDKTED